MTRWLRWRRSPPPRLPRPVRRYIAGVWPHYRRLPRARRSTFDAHAARFLAERRITGVKMEVDDRVRALVAASAATLSAGWKDYRWSRVAEVLIYPDSFDRDFVIGPAELAGIADPWGTIVISAPSLTGSFEHPADGYHVGLHELAHLLQEPESVAGVPRNLRNVELAEWEALQNVEMEAVRTDQSVLDPYGGSSPRELFPVAVETFFERPVLLRRKHERLYAFLRAYFGQDPAAWEREGAI